MQHNRAILPIKTSLCYIEKDGKYLMLYRNKKENDPNSGKWIGVGGKFEIKRGRKTTPEPFCKSGPVIDLYHRDKCHYAYSFFHHAD